jgi:hypothetical protein
LKIPPWVSYRVISQSPARRKPYKKTLKYIYLVYKKVKSLGSMIRWLRAEVLTRMLIDSKNMHNIFHVSSVEGFSIQLQKFMKIVQEKNMFV